VACVQFDAMCNAPFIDACCVCVRQWLIVGSLTPSDSFSHSRDAAPGGYQQQEVARQQQQLGHALLQTRRISVGSRQWQWSFESVGREVVEVLLHQ